MDNIDAIKSTEDLQIAVKSLDQKIKQALYEKAVLTKKIDAWNKQKDELTTQINLSNLQKKSSINWLAETFPWSNKLQQILNDTFKLKSFRSEQLSAINATLSKNDLILLMPTGSGKTLCYQLPAILENGVTLVVSPLISLIEDQIINLKRLRIYAVAMNSSTENGVKKSTFEYLNKGLGKAPSLIYVTPEFLSKSKRLMAGLQKCAGSGNFNRIAIDEVHCCSQWGHDFRPDYNYLGMLKEIFPEVPILGVTATATNNVILDLQQMLNLENSSVIKSPFDRPNINFQVRTKLDNLEELYATLCNLLKTKYKHKSGIIYGATINDCIEISKQLRSNGIKAGCYHAHMDKEPRTKVHEKWLNDEYNVIVATVAFGMGIDKPDVRYVIHYSLPKSMETLYQEAGRAGRDGQPADHVILFKLSDYFKNSGNTKSKTETANALAVLKYCLNFTKCRHNLLADAFEQELDQTHCSAACDNCNSQIAVGKYNLYLACQEIFEVIDDARKSPEPKHANLTMLKLLTAWLKVSKKDSNKRRATLNQEQCERIVAELLLKGYLIEEKNFTPYSVNVYLRRGINASLKNVSKIIADLPAKSNLDHYLKRQNSGREQVNGENAEQISKKIKLSE